MGENFERRTPSVREVEQAITALKKGAHLLKCGRRGKPKFRPFRLSTDEKSLIWYSGEKEKHLNLNAVVKLVRGQQTVNFLRQNQIDNKLQSFSLIYENGQRSLDLICTDKEQADSWYLGLTALVSSTHLPRPLANISSSRWAHSCVNSPVGYITTNHKPGLVHGSAKLAKVRSLYGSPARSLLDKHLSDRMLKSSDEFYSPRQRTLSDIQSYLDKILPRLPHVVSYTEKDKTDGNLSNRQRLLSKSKLSLSEHESPKIYVNDGLRDVFIWGEGVAGGILGSDIDSSVPKLLDSTRALDVRNISCGDKNAALVTKQGEVFCWGVENGGRLGHKVTMDAPCPKIVESLTGICVQKVVCGAQCTFAITNASELYAWGDSNHGLDLSGDRGHKSHWFPHKISGPLDGLSISRIACGEWHTAIVSSSGQLFTYGDGTFGVLGHGDTKSVSQPKEVESLKGSRVKSVACGPWHTAAVVDIAVGHVKGNSPGGKLFSWGDNDKGRLGHADKNRKLTPTCVASLVDCDFVQVSCGIMLTVALTITGRVFTVGSSVHGQLGNPQAEDVSITRVEGLLRNESIKEISTGSFHVTVLTTKGKVYTWGKGGNGQLGLGDNKDRNSPTLVESLEDRHVDSIDCGSNFTAVTCLHKIISSKDQSLCTGCKLVFGFARKKHNCYNCGFMFCHSCSSKKAMNAALAPKKCKRCRVCDACFTQLHKISDPRTNMEISTPRPLLLTVEGYSDLKVKKEQSSLSRENPFFSKLPSLEETKLIEGNAESMREEKNKHNTQSLTARRWGHVPCPLQFLEHARESSLKVVPISGQEISDILGACSQNSMLEINNVPSKAGSLKHDLDNVDKILTEELHRLQNEAKSLTQKCQSRSQKLQLYKCKIEENWLLAKDEAEKCKAANGVIKILSSQMNALTEKPPARKRMSHIGSSADVIEMCHPMQTKCLNPKDDQLVSGSGHQLTNQNQSSKHQAYTGMSNDTPTAGGNAKIYRTNELKNESVEQVEVGVYITFITLPSGQKGLKRVRFSRKHFGEKDAEVWWEENQRRIYSKYNIEKIVTPP
ncbi:PH, RCC1 and FYVE domains-containing protein 1-like isoform X1 [Zingiber officinale]|nr:PH, RCC1 and FYVE domains-containing protein 1-like isoform X1 [Zingiber officinale]